MKVNPADIQKPGKQLLAAYPVYAFFRVSPCSSLSVKRVDPAVNADITASRYVMMSLGSVITPI
jgi:hypothetical protein